MKRKIMIIALAVLLIALSVGGSLAYFSETSEIYHNIITTGAIDVELIEKDGNGGPFENIEGALPGVSYGKEVTVKNTGTADAYVRVSVVLDGEFAETSATKPDLSLVTLDYNTTDWTDGGDGYWYYNAALKPGDTTKPLFTTVTFDPKMGNEYQNSTFTIDVAAQAVQVANNGDSALTAAGWPAAGGPV